MANLNDKKVFKALDKAVAAGLERSFIEALITEQMTEKEATKAIKTATKQYKKALKASGNDQAYAQELAQFIMENGGDKAALKAAKKDAKANYKAVKAAIKAADKAGLSPEDKAAYVEAVAQSADSSNKKAIKALTKQVQKGNVDANEAAAVAEALEGRELTKDDIKDIVKDIKNGNTQDAINKAEETPKVDQEDDTNQGGDTDGEGEEDGDTDGEDEEEAPVIPPAPAPTFTVTVEDNVISFGENDTATGDITFTVAADGKMTFKKGTTTAATTVDIDAALTIASEDTAKLDADAADLSVAVAAALKELLAKDDFDANDKSFTIKDTLANLSDDDAADIISAAKEYTISDEWANVHSKLAEAVVTGAAEVIVTDKASLDIAGFDALPDNVELAGGYDLADTAASLKDGDNAGAVAGAADIQVTEAASVADIAAIVDNGVTLANMSFELSDVWANIEAEQGIFDQATAITVTDTADFTIAEFDAVPEKVTYTTYTISDEWGNIKELLEDDVITEADTVTVTDKAEDLSIEDAEAALAVPVVFDANYTISDEWAKVQPKLAEAVVTGAAEVIVTDKASLDIAGFDALPVNVELAGGYDLADTAANLKNVANADTVAEAVDIQVTEAASVADITAIVANGATLANMSFALSDNWANIAAQQDILAQATAVTVTDEADFTIAEFDEVPEKVTYTTYTITDTWDNIKDLLEDDVITEAETVTVTGAVSADASVIAGLDPKFDLSEAESISYDKLGTAENTAAAGVEDVVDTFVVTATDAEFTITDFEIGGDKDMLDLSALVTQGLAELEANTELVADKLFFLATGQAGDADSNESAALAITANVETDLADDTSAFFIISDDDSTSVYEYKAANGKEGVQAEELTLVGTVEAVVDFNNNLDGFL